MTVYELIRYLAGYPPDEKIVFEIGNITLNDCDFTYRPILKEVHIEPK